MKKNSKDLENVSGGRTVSYNGEWAIMDDETGHLVHEGGKIITFSDRHKAIDFDEDYHTRKI